MWWGSSSNFASAIGNRSNKVIISFYDKHYIDTGYGNAFGNDYGRIRRWDDMF